MKTEDRLRDPIFQLNLLLWMAKEQPAEGYRVRPLFHQCGFRIIYIENPFPFPEATIQQVAASVLDISQNPEADLILGHDHNGKGLYFEAKANSFGPDSTTAKQGRAHLVATGRVFGEVLAPLKSCLLCYVVPQSACDRMGECLVQLTEELSEGGLNAGQYSVHGLELKNGCLVYSWDDSFQGYVCVEGNEGNECSVIDDVMDDTYPIPLLLVYSDEDCFDDEHRDFYRRAMIEQLHASLLCDVQALGIASTYEITPDKLLNRSTEGFFDYVGSSRQKGLRRLVRKNMFGRIAEYWKTRQPNVRLTGDSLGIRWETVNERSEFLEWLEDHHNTRFEAIRPQEEVLPLFDDPPGQPCSP